MKKALWLSIPILAAVILVAAWTIVEHGRPPGWQ
jgi:hypothetical protein